MLAAAELAVEGFCASRTIGTITGAIEWLPDKAGRTPLTVAAAGDALDRDTIWNGTPREWAVHARKPCAAAYLERVEASAAGDHTES